MDQAAPTVFDRVLQRRRLRRALAGGYEPFLLERVAAELVERLGAVNRTFPLALDLGTPTVALAEALAGSVKAATVIRLAPAAERGPRLLAVGDEESLPFGPGLFDLAVSALSLQEQPVGLQRPPDLHERARQVVRCLE